MTIKFNPPREVKELKPRIAVIGAGGGGCNAINNMIQGKLEGVEFIAANSDAQALTHCLADRKIQLGPSITQGLGAGARPEIGRAAAEESINEIIDQLDGTHMAFVTVGLGGGTGTGSAPVIAQAARDLGILTVGVATKPFHFEGARRMEHAEQGLAELEQYVDTLIVIPNQNLFRVANEKTTFADAFKMADDVLYSGVRGITDLIMMPGLINLDFADIRTVMSEMGKAMMGTGEADGESRALDAAEAAISNPLLDDISMQGARGVLINITGGPDMTLFEVDEAANRIRDEVDPNANIIFGSTFDKDLEGKVRVSVVATGINFELANQSKPAATSYKAPSFSQSSSRPAAQAAAAATSAATAPKKEVAEEPAPVAEPKLSAKTEIEDAPFIAPQPVEIDEFTESIASESNADPFAAAALENGGQSSPATAEKAEKSAPAPSLFERMTGRNRKEEPETLTPTKDNQPRLEAVDVEERVESSQDEDLLEIPAFLRRQLN